MRYLKARSDCPSDPKSYHQTPYHWLLAETHMLLSRTATNSTGNYRHNYHLIICLYDLIDLL